MLATAIDIKCFERLGEKEFVQFGDSGEAFQIEADTDAVLMVLSGEPIREPVFGYGPFVMNTEDEIRTAISDYRSGKMGHLR